MLIINVLNNLDGKILFSLRIKPAHVLRKEGFEVIYSQLVNLSSESKC